jgi:hypothetical protein
MSLSSSLVNAFNNHPLGLCGRHEAAQCVLGIDGIERRLNVLTFGAIVDANFLSEERWSALKANREHWLLDPSQTAYRPSPQVWAAMQELNISGPRHIARVWWQVCRGVQGRFKGSWRALIRANDDSAPTLQAYLQKNRATFPVLAGPIISARWLDLVHRMGGVELKDWESLTVDLPADQGRAARLFGIMTDTIHPYFASALHTWSKSCQAQTVENCGLEDCPKRK